MRTMEIVVAAAAIALSTMVQSAPVEGSYACDGCHGFLKINRAKANTYSAVVMVGEGSCGGMIYAKGTSPLLGGELKLKYKEKEDCTVTIALNGNNAHVSDSCHADVDEASTTCTVLGEYVRQ